MRTPGRAVLVAAVLLLFAAACGGSGGDVGVGPSLSGGSTDNTVTPTASGDSSGSDAPTTEPAGEGSASSGSSSDLGDDTAVVTIGDEVFEFDVSVLCLSAFGAFGVAGRASDGTDVQLQLDLPPNDWETRDDSADWDPPSVSVLDDASQRQWMAEIEPFLNLPSVEPGMSQVTSFNIDGNSATGAASFIELNSVLMGGAPEPLDGTFQVSCDDEPYG